MVGVFTHKGYDYNEADRGGSQLLPDSLKMECATKSACLSVLSTPVVRKVGVMSVGGSFTCDPKT